MNYIGSKKSLLEFIEESVNKVVNNQKMIFLDLFAGTGIVGQHFKALGNTVVANDIQYYSYVLNRNYIGNHKLLGFNNLQIPNLNNVELPLRAEYVCKYLENLQPKEGFIYKNYCLGGTSGSTFERQYFSDENGKKIDAIRIQIEEWYRLKALNEDEYYFLLASLVEGADKVANTASVYGAFLKKIKKTAQASLTMKPANFFINEKEHFVYNQDANSLIRKLKGDVLYLDPPYNHRQYATNYHILETISKYDNPTIKGKTGLRNYDSQKSKYCLKNQALKSFRNIILNANVNYIFLSYNNEGIMTPEEIKSIMQMRGTYGVFKREYQRFKADKDEHRNHKANQVVEYIHYVVCS